VKTNLVEMCTEQCLTGPDDNFKVTVFPTIGTIIREIENHFISLNQVVSIFHHEGISSVNNEELFKADLV
jgi:hypothetical protein